VIESAAGYAALHQIAADPGVARLVLGHIDFMADTGIVCSEGEPELSALRFEIAMATRLRGLAPAVDGATIQISDLDLLRRDMRRSLQYGFGGKICIHPSQVAVVHEVCEPTEEELQWANKVLRADEASGGGPVQVDGRLVELPLVLQARRTLARAGGLR
jgi:citrate lyase subunit beta/citryl-CoA lyase